MNPRRLATRDHLVCMLLAVCGAALACGDSGGGATAPQGLSPDDFCEASIERLCERQVGCNVALVNQATTVASCLAQERRTCDPREERFARSVEAGNADFDPEALAGCRDELDELSCVELAAGARPSSCGDVFVGGAELGEPCFTDVECAGVARCATAGQCPGECVEDAEPTGRADCRLTGCPQGQYCQGAVCAPNLSSGAECRQPDACADDHYCGKDVGEPELLCRSRKATGDVCFSRDNCAEGLSCQPTGAGERQCAPALEAGDTCLDDDECAAGLICDPERFQCGPPRGDEEPCVPGDCADGFYCWTFNEAGDAACRARSVVGIAEGELCHPDFDRCRLGLYCRAARPAEFGRCALLPGVGEPCADFANNLNEECRQGVCVESQGQLECVALRENGDPCDSRDECISDTCVDGVCAEATDLTCAPP